MVCSTHSLVPICTPVVCHTHFRFYSAVITANYIAVCLDANLGAVDKIKHLVSLNWKLAF